MSEATPEAVNPKTSMTQAEARQFVRDHFEQFVNRRNLAVADVNFARDFVDHGADVPPGLPPGHRHHLGSAHRVLGDRHLGDC